MTTPQSNNLLRMLEPAVRPGQAAGPRPAATPSFEQQPFDQLLAQATAETTETTDTESTTPQHKLISALGSIENASVRQMLEKNSNGRD